MYNQKIKNPLDEKDLNGMTKFMNICKHEHEKIIQALENGANPNIMDYAGRTPLYHYIWSTVYIKNSISTNMSTNKSLSVINENIIKSFIQHKADIGMLNAANLCEIMLITNFNSKKNIIKILHQNGLKIPESNNNKATFLMSAIKNNTEYASFLLNNINVEELELNKCSYVGLNRSIDNALISAIKYNPKLLIPLIKLGADVLLKDDSTDRTILQSLFWQNKKENADFYLHQAIIYLFEKNKILIADLNHLDKDKNSILFYAVSQKFNKTASLLIDLGVACQTENINGETPLSTCNNQFGIAKKLIAHGADINQKNAYGDSILQTAICNGNFSLINFLMKYNIHKNHTPSMFECALQNPSQTLKVIKFLIEKKCFEMNYQDYNIWEQYYKKEDYWILEKIINPYYPHKIQKMHLHKSTKQTKINKRNIL